VDITGYVDHLRADLIAAAASGGEAMVEAAERLATTLDSAVRMALLEALSDAAAEITGDLNGGTVEVRLKGREPQFVVTVPAAGEPDFPPSDAPGEASEDDEGGTARITLRLPETLKQRAEEAAGRTRQSLNTWLVEAIRAATRAPDVPRDRHRVGQHLSGWAR
jgi:hypothetical protein